VYPYLLHSGHIFLPTFGLLAAIGLMAALTLSYRTASAVGLSPDGLWNAGLFTVLCAFVLSRLLLMSTNLSTFRTYPFLLLAVPSLTPIGLLLTMLVTAAYLRLRHLPLLPALDAWAPCATLAWGFLALGHLAEGSDPGLPASRWGLAIPRGSLPSYPVPLYVAIVAAVLTVLLLLRLSRRRHPGETAALALATVGVSQFLLSFLRLPTLYADSAILSILDPIQWVSLGLITAAALILILQPGKVATHAL
jgi:phosphatidylglycerol:prolipoprotein diacylglycerol transferase